MSYLSRQGNNLVLQSVNVFKPLKIVKSCTGSLGVAGLQMGRQVGGNSLGNSHYVIMLLSEENIWYLPQFYTGPETRTT